LTTSAHSHAKASMTLDVYADLFHDLEVVTHAICGTNRPGAHRYSCHEPCHAWGHVLHLGV